MTERREFLKGVGLGGALAWSGGVAQADAQAVAGNEMTHESEALFEVVNGLPYDDTHCHAITDTDAVTTPQDFLERISLVAFPASSYFPDGIYQSWKDGDESTRAHLDREHGIQSVIDEITYHVRESIFIKALVKELATFLGCKPNLEAVIEARNDRGRSNYWGYVNALFRDVNAANLMIDTGYAEGMDAAGIRRFEDAVAPAQGRRIYRVETISDELFKQDLSFDELENRFVAMVKQGLDGDGNFGARSYGMKSYLMPRIGVVKPLYDSKPARLDWERFRSDPDKVYADREVASNKTRDLDRYLLTLALEECLERDMPMQFHAGDGEAPYVILRQQDPYNLEEVVRFDRNGVMRRPKIIPVHAGYPLVGKATWLSHLYTNCYFELSIMTPLIHRGLIRRYLQVLEAVPISKILFSSDAYHVPELYWLTGRWGKRYLSQALGAHVRSGTLTHEEALAAARMILYENNRRVYNLGDA